MFSGFVFVGLIVQLAWAEQAKERAGVASCADDTNNCELCDVLIGDKLYCSKCKASAVGHAPIDGKCADAASKTPCKENADGKCTECTGQSFMYKGGCYQVSQEPGQTMCKTAADGKCTEAPASKSYFVIPETKRQPTGQTVVWCGDNAGVTSGGQTYKGVIGCTTCDGSKLTADASGEAVCSACGNNKIVKIAKDSATSCVTEDDCTGAEGFFVKGNLGSKTCEACAETCKTCKTEAAKCTSCKNDKPYLKKAQSQDQTGECVTEEVCKREGTHYADDSKEPKTCRTCAEGTFEACEACEKSREGAVTCRRCKSQKKVQPNKKGCIDACPPNVSVDSHGICECVEGYVPDEIGTGCKEESAPPAPPVAQCSTPGCKTCDKPKTDEEVCTECEDPKLLTPTGQCIDKCGDLGGYYEGTNDKKKKACKKCEVANCLLCNEKGKCAACKAGFYGEACAACNSACKNCSGPTAADCTECSSGRALKYDTSGAKGTCEAGCKPNASGCEKCELTVEGTTYCSKCKEAGQFPQNGVCSAAAGRAVTCATQGTGVCDKCTNGFLRMGGGCYETAKFPGKSVCADANADADTCKTPVPGYKVEAGKLVTCSEGCDTCNDANTCTKCKDGYVLITSKCTPCSAGCATCTNTASACETCSTGYYKSKNACVLCTANNAENTITGVANCASCAPPSNNQGSVLCYLMKDGGSTNKGGLSTGAIAGIVVAVVIVVGGLVGFLCWWFMCRGKA
ncbi:VSP [Giardia lamblia P15]|uniref:VSP n=1 Tax=Giardia intestinalis (strain P15) TaxID=658858 RepID=E1F6T5_GIAIA|nr:VSP [Giardia lamblia P15]